MAWSAQLFCLFFYQYWHFLFFWKLLLVFKFVTRLGHVGHKYGPLASPVSGTPVLSSRLGLLQGAQLPPAPDSFSWFQHQRQSSSVAGPGRGWLAWAW